MDLTKEQAVHASGMCIDNALSFLEDARLLYSKKRLQHTWISYQFAFEELGKATVMIEQLEQNQNPIVLSDEMRKRHQIRSDYIKDLIKITNDRIQHYEDVWANFPMPFAKVRASELAQKFANLDQAIIDDVTESGHKRRIDCFTNFDENTCEPKIGDPARNDHCKISDEIIEKIIGDLRNRLEKVN